MTYVKTTVANPEKPLKKFEGEFLVDSGATYSVVPERDLKKLVLKGNLKF